MDLCGIYIAPVEIPGGFALVIHLIIMTKLMDKSSHIAISTVSAVIKERRIVTSGDTRGKTTGGLVFTYRNIYEIMIHHIIIRNHQIVRDIRKMP